MSISVCNIVRISANRCWIEARSVFVDSLSTSAERISMLVPDSFSHSASSMKSRRASRNASERLGYLRVFTTSSSFLRVWGSMDIETIVIALLRKARRVFGDY